MHTPGYRTCRQEPGVHLIKPGRSLLGPEQQTGQLHDHEHYTACNVYVNYAKSYPRGSEKMSMFLEHQCCLLTQESQENLITECGSQQGFINFPKIYEPPPNSGNRRSDKSQTETPKYWYDL